MAPWLRFLTALAVSLIVVAVLIHPDVDLLDGVLHHGLDLLQGPVLMASGAGGGLSAGTVFAVEGTTAIHGLSGPDSLDLFCVRLCWAQDPKIERLGFRSRCGVLPRARQAKGSAIDL
jgi:hypothetical protein